MVRLPACKIQYSSGAIPKPKHCDRERIEAFGVVLRRLFNQYEEWQPEHYHQGPKYWREKALLLSSRPPTSNDMDVPMQICEYALNTGAPSDEILAVYSLLFL